MSSQRIALHRAMNNQRKRAREYSSCLIFLLLTILLRTASVAVAYHQHSNGQIWQVAAGNASRASAKMLKMDFHGRCRPWVPCICNCVVPQGCNDRIIRSSHKFAATWSKGRRRDVIAMASRAIFRVRGLCRSTLDPKYVIVCQKAYFTDQKE